MRTPRGHARHVHTPSYACTPRGARTTPHTPRAHATRACHAHMPLAHATSTPRACDTILRALMASAREPTVHRLVPLAGSPTTASAASLWSTRAARDGRTRTTRLARAPRTSGITMRRHLHALRLHNPTIPDCVAHHSPATAEYALPTMRAHRAYAQRPSSAFPPMRRRKPSSCPKDLPSPLRRVCTVRCASMCTPTSSVGATRRHGTRTTGSGSAVMRRM